MRRELTDIVIRMLTVQDAVAYKALRDEMLAIHPTAFTSDAASEASRPATSYAGRLGSEATGFTLGAWHGDVLVGAVTCDRDARIKVRHIGHLVGMMIRPSHEGRGAASALLTAFLDQLRKDGSFRIVTLTVTADNLRAVELYQRSGFQPYGRLPDAIFVDGRHHDKLLMRFELL